MRDAEPELEARGARLYIIGNGRPDHAKYFAERMNMAGKVFTDPSRAVYRALGMKGGLSSGLKLDVLRHAWRAYRGGHRQRSTQGDPWQQGGVIVVARGGELLYAYVSETAGDHPEPSGVLRALAPTTG